MQAAAAGADKGVLGKAADAVSDLTAKYAPNALGGAPADAQAGAVSRAGAGLGANPAAGEQPQGLSPKPGYPRDAPVREAPTGGVAASIGGIAAAVAAGESESSAARKVQANLICLCKAWLLLLYVPP